MYKDYLENILSDIKDKLRINGAILKKSKKNLQMEK